jgi:peptidoglycan/xylan/chitin deacetylase (PgdA/CDA1 family)
MAADGVILVFHQTSAKFYPGINNVPPGFFFAVIELLERWGLALRPDSERDVSIATITFDDAYEENLPVLSALCDLDIHPILFVPTDYIGKSNRWEYSSRLFPARHLDARQIRRLSDSGVVIGSHGASHRSFLALDRPARKAELEHSKKTLEDITGKPVLTISFPFGRFDEAVISDARQCGFTHGYGLGPARQDQIHPDTFITPRLAVYGNDDYYSLRRRLVDTSRWETIKTSIIWRLAGGTTAVSLRTK